MSKLDTFPRREVSIMVACGVSSSSVSPPPTDDDDDDDPSSDVDSNGRELERDANPIFNL